MSGHHQVDPCYFLREHIRLRKAFIYSDTEGRFCVLIGYSATGGRPVTVNRSRVLPVKTVTAQTHT